MDESKSESKLPQELMSRSLLHFESGVPIDDLSLRPDQRRRLARVQHVYWQWIKNPWLDTYQLFRQMVKGQFAHPPGETAAAKADQRLFEFVRDHVAPPSRAESRAKVYAAADKMMQIGMQNDDVMALDKGSKRMYDVAGLDKPESEQTDLSKALFLPPVVTTSAKEVDPTKEDQDDEQARQIMNKYNAYVDDKRKAVDDRVEVMMAKRKPSEETKEEEYTEE